MVLPLTKDRLIDILMDSEPVSDDRFSPDEAET